MSVFDDVRASGHPERMGWVKCKGCGAHRPPERIATANGTIPGVYMEGCAPVRIECDTRRYLRDPKGDDVAGPVVRPVVPEASGSSVKCERCGEVLPHFMACSATVDPEQGS